MYTVKTLPEFDKWLNSLKDRITRLRLSRRLDKAQRGNLGDVKPVGEGVFEMREHFGPGWRMYYAMRAETLIVMLGWGDKDSQESDIAKAKQREATLEDWTMKKRIADLPDFDMAEQLRSEEDIAAYITMVIEDGDAAELAHALGVAAKARGMSEVAKSTGITREALYKALKPNAKPRFDTINKVCAALGVRLVAQPANPRWAIIHSQWCQLIFFDGCLGMIVIAFSMIAGGYNSFDFFAGNRFL